MWGTQIGQIVEVHLPSDPTTVLSVTVQAAP